MKYTTILMCVLLITGCAHIDMTKMRIQYRADKQTTSESASQHYGLWQKIKETLKKLLPHPEPWTRGEKFMLGISFAAAIADCYTTERMLDRGYHEMNPLIGKHPTDTELLVKGWLGYAGIVLFVHLYPEYRYLILGSQALTCSGFAAHNSTLK